MPHHFRQSSDFEKSWQQTADRFYKSKYENCLIRRYNTDTKEDMEFQKKDIDLTLILPDKSVHISEKIRKEDYGDLLIELYSKYPDVKGWMKESEAEFLAYFAQNKMYVINKHHLSTWYESENIEEKFEQNIFEFHSENKEKSSRKELQISTRKGNHLAFQLIQAFNKIQDSHWYTISIAISWEDLKKEGLDVKKYKI